MIANRRSKGILHCAAMAAIAALLITASPARADAIDDLHGGARAIEQGKYGQAISLFEEAISSGALNEHGLALAHHHRGIAEQKLGQPAAAIADYSKAIAGNALPEAVLARAHYNRGIAYSQLGEDAKAEADYRETVKLVPSYGAAYHNLANIERRRGNQKAAISNYTKALEYMSGDARKYAFHGRGLSYEAEGGKSQAKADYEAALEIDNDFAPAKTELAALNRPQPKPLIGSDTAMKGGESKARVIRVASATGWETTAVKYANPAGSVSPAPADNKAVRSPDRLANIDNAVSKPSPGSRTVAAEATPAPGPYQVQLGAYRDEETAKIAWRNLQTRSQGRLSGIEHRVVRADLGDRGIFYRLRAGGYAEESVAHRLCARLSTVDIDCVVPR
ncbi:tetratricopeptide (TPR) repeat protein [Parvibaculum indicum]|uniref:SPOR domain-containing protein n=1 Tax=Parvibaculum indicum TaxID=562969 RepID=UPI001424342C|nr:tetratricopeptide repeat protein [Parvibaculum indicum]NIJ39803.1 tetratricopeptide (TPR) repeat protein [Parvibaculum indicum]